MYLTMRYFISAQILNKFAIKRHKASCNFYFLIARSQTKGATFTNKILSLIASGPITITNFTTKFVFVFLLDQFPSL